MNSYRHATFPSFIFFISRCLGWWLNHWWESCCHQPSSISAACSPLSRWLPSPSQCHFYPTGMTRNPILLATACPAQPACARFFPRRLTPCITTGENSTMPSWGRFSAGGASCPSSPVPQSNKASISCNEKRDRQTNWSSAFLVGIDLRFVFC